MNGTIQNVEDNRDGAVVTVAMDGSRPNESVKVALDKSAPIFLRWKSLLTVGEKIGGIVLNGGAVDLRASLVHSLSVTQAAPVESASRGGPQLRAQIKKPPGIEGLWLQIENYGRGSNENAVWWNDRGMATRFHSIDEFKLALARHNLESSEYRLFAPKGSLK